MKRLLQCEEWSRLRVGQGLELATFDDLTSILLAWKRNTGTDPSAFFEIRPDSLIPKFWSGTLDCQNLVLEVSPIGSMSLGSIMRGRLDASITAMLANVTSSSSMSAGVALLSGDGNRYDTLLRVFCEELQLARRRQILRRYVSARACLSSPKGRISFPSQCYESIRRPGKFSSEWVALSEDVPENRIFREVLVRYRPRCSASIRGVIDLCLAEMDAVSTSGDCHMEWSRVRTDRLPLNYISLLNQSKSLLDDNGAGIFFGDTLSTSEIVFTSRLFERYIAKEMQWIAPALGLRVSTQIRGTYLCSRIDGESSFEVIPDIRLNSIIGQTKFIVDTKWKYLNPKLRNFGISGGDIYQILIYAAKYECLDVVLLYPDVSDTTGECGFHEIFSAPLAGRSYRIHIVRIPLLATSLHISRSYLQRIFSEGLQKSLL